MVDTANVTSGISSGVYDVVWRVAREFKWAFIAAGVFTVLANFEKLFPFLSRWKECLNYRTARFNTNHSLGRPLGSPVLSYEHIPCRTDLAANYLRQLFELPMYMFQYIALGHRQLGPVFRDNLGGSTELVFVADATCVPDVHRASGPYPGHLVPDAWTLYLKMTSKKRGLFFMDGPEWAEMRHILNQRLVRPASVRPHFPALDGRTVGLMEALWAAERAGTLKDGLVTELYRWSLECICVITLGRKIGTFKCESEPGFQFVEFVNAIRNIFHETAAMGSMPAEEARDKQTKAWQNFCRSCDTALDVASRYVAEAAADVRDADKTTVGDSCLLRRLLVDDGVDEETATRLIADLFLAAADTTVWTCTWLLYVTSQRSNFGYIVKAITEVENCHLPEGYVSMEPLKLCYDDLRKMPSVRNIVKETLRLYPVAPFLTRSLATDCVTLGYTVPADKMIIVSLYSIGRDPKYFKNPEIFYPDRWETDTREACSVEFEKVGTEGETVHQSNIPRADPNIGLAKLAALPWGIGSRNCLGRTVADTLLTLFIVHLVMNFDVEIKNNDIHMKMEMISVPSEVLDIQLKRNCDSYLKG